MTNLSDPRAVRSREALHKALLGLLGKKPLSDITIREVVAEAGIGYNTFFRHHPDLESLLTEITEIEIDGLIQKALSILMTEDLRSATKALFSYVDKHRALWKTLLTGGAGGTIREAFLDRARTAALPITGKNLKIPADCGLLLIVSGTLELIDWWLRSSRKISVNRVSEIFEIAVVLPIMQANNFSLKE